MAYLIDMITNDPNIKLVDGFDSRETLEARIAEYVDNLFDNDAVDAQGNPTSLVRKDYTNPGAAGLNVNAIMAILKDLADGTDNFYNAHKAEILAMFATEEAKTYAQEHGVDFDRAIDESITDHIMVETSSQSAAGNVFDVPSQDEIDALVKALNEAKADLAAKQAGLAAGNNTNQDVTDAQQVVTDAQAKLDEALAFTLVSEFAGLTVTNDDIDGFTQLKLFKNVVDNIVISDSIKEAFGVYLEVGQQVPAIFTMIDTPDTVTEFVNMYLRAVASGATEATSIDFTKPLNEQRALTTTEQGAITQARQDLAAAETALNDAANAASKTL